MSHLDVATLLKWTLVCFACRKLHKWSTLRSFLIVCCFSEMGLYYNWSVSIHWTGWNAVSHIRSFPLP